MGLSSFTLYRRLITRREMRRAHRTATINQILILDSISVKIARKIIVIYKMLPWYPNSHPHIILAVGQNSNIPLTIPILCLLISILAGVICRRLYLVRDSQWDPLSTQRPIMGYNKHPKWQIAPARNTFRMRLRPNLPLYWTRNHTLMQHRQWPSPRLAFTLNSHHFLLSSQQKVSMKWRSQ